MSVERYSMPASDLREALGRLIPTVDVFIAPVTDRHDETFFVPVTDADEIVEGWRNSLASPTNYLYPPRETLFEFDLTDPEPSLDFELDERSRIIFGMRSCDTKAVGYLDEFLLGGDFVDTQYEARRNNTKLITVGCVTPAFDTCWCGCSNSGPISDGGYDIQLTPVEDRLLVEVAEGGQEIAEIWRDLLTPASERLVELRDEQTEVTRRAMAPQAHMGSAMRRVTSGAPPADFWNDLGDRCNGCGGCSTVCPKCTCFSAVDEMLTDKTGRRTRIKDSCRLRTYSLEASGHNPRELAAQRAKRWSYHKLSQGYVERNGQHGCVGCGRCTQVCMGGVAMPHVARSIRKAGRHE